MLHSAGCGSLTFTIMSARAKTSAAVAAICAPAASYCGSVRPIAAPAPTWTCTWWPCAVSSCTLAGVSPTRYSWFLTSLGRPTRIVFPCGLELANPMEAASGDGNHRPGVHRGLHLRIASSADRHLARRVRRHLSDSTTLTVQRAKLVRSIEAEPGCRR